MFQESIENLKAAFEWYYGTGKYFLLLLFALIYLFIKEDSNNKKAFLVGYSCLAIFIIINPIFMKIVSPFVDDTVYNRLLWVIPSGVIISYAGVLVVKNISKLPKKIIVFCALVITIVFSGQFVYSKANFVKTENIYKIPDEYLEVSKIVGDIPIYPRKVMVSTDLIEYIRLVAPNVLTVYPRRPDGYKDYPIVDFYEAGDVKTLTMLCKENDVNIIVYDRSILLTISPKYFGYDYYTSTDKYDIYVLKDNI